MRRGMAAWKSGHRPGAGQEQWGYARVNSFLTQAPGTWGRPIKDPAKSRKKQKWAELQNNAVGADSSAIAGKPYNPDFRGHLDTVITNLYGITTLVNDRSRVYKGGSWEDNAYWLGCHTRRFLDERQSTRNIGFRCAMDRVGSPTGKNYGKRKKRKS